ncbi:hypothetical protein L7F22_030923 [Adiantum nelumboides]|nr:hypothetical protein [Adiantum nelumboides]
MRGSRVLGVQRFWAVDLQAQFREKCRVWRAKTSPSPPPGFKPRRPPWKFRALATGIQGAGKQKGTTSKAVRSPKPHVQSIAKNNVGVEQQKEIAEPSKVPPPTERNKAEKKQGAEIQKETAASFEDPRMQKKKANKKPGSEKPTETTMSSEVVGSQIIHENSAGEKKQGLEKGKIPLLIEFSRMLLEEDRAAELPKQQAMKTKGKGSLVKPTEKVQVPKEVKKPKGKDTSAPPNLSKASKQQVKRKLPLQAATLGSPSKRAKVESSGPLKSADLLLPSRLPSQPYIELYIDGKLVRMCRADLACPSQNTKMKKQTRIMDHLRKQHGLNVAIPTRVGGRVGVGSVPTEDEDTAEDSSDQLKEYEKRGPAKQTVKVKKEEKASDLVEIYDSSDEKEVKEDREEAKDEGGEEESGEEEENSICQEGEEEEDEGGDEEDGDEEGVDDEEEGGEKAEEEGRESDEDGSDGEKTDEGEGSTGDDEGSKDDGNGSGDDKKGSGDDGKGDEEGDRAKSMNGSDEGDGVGASTDGSGSDERDGVGWTVEDEESTPEQSGGGGTPGAVVALASMKGHFSLGLSFTSMEVIRFLEGNMY